MLMACGVSLCAMNMNAAEVSQEDQQARALYCQALEKFDLGDYKETIKLLDKAEKLLKQTNARISYLRARSQNALGNDIETQKACKTYFASEMIKDDGFALMTTLNDEVSIRLDSINRDRFEKAVAAKEEAEAAAEAKAEAAKNRANVMKMAAERRAKDVEDQKVAKEAELKIFQEVQKKNTKEAYQQFILNHPCGFYVDKAKQEMNKKWPTPIRVLKKNLYGYEKAGQVVVKAKYDYGSDFCEGMARVSKGGKYGYVNEAGKEIIPLIYKSASNFNYGYAVVKTADNKAFFINKEGKKMNENVYGNAKAFSEGLAAVENEFGMYGFIDVEGNEVIPCEYNTVSFFSEGLVSVSKRMDDGKIAYSYLKTNGEKLVPFEYEDAKDFKDGIALVKQNGKFGLIDKFGGPIAECEYDYIYSFNGEGYALAKKNGWDVYLDKEGTPWAKANGKYIKVNY